MIKRFRSQRKLRCEQLEDRRLLAVVTVDTTEDVVDFNDNRTSLREAIFAAGLVPGADEIVFDFGNDEPATIVLTEGELRIVDNLTLTGPGSDRLTIDASGNDPTPDENNGDGSRVFQISSGRDGIKLVNISGMTLRGGDVTSSGGAITSYAQLTLTDVVVSSNFAMRDGGGLELRGIATLHDSDISNNRSGANGGGIKVSSGADVRIEDSRIVGNESAGGGGGLWSSRVASTKIFDSSVTKNKASGFGGGLGFQSDTAVIHNTNVAGNSALEGGGIYATSGSLTLQDTSVIGNNSNQAGGGIGLRGVTTEIVGGTISGNFTNQNESRGGGIAQVGGQLSIHNATLFSNKARAQATRGGAISVSEGSLALYGGRIEGNISLEAGGGIAAEFSNVSLHGTVLGNNRGSMFGGAIDSRDSDLQIVGATFGNNSASDGGALRIDGGGISIFGSHFVGNSASEGSGGAIALADSQNESLVKIVESQFSGNTAGIQGGAINANALAIVDVRQSNFSSNSSETGDGGAIYSGFNSELSISESALVGNNSGKNGGAIFSRARLSINSSLLMQNGAQSDGGALYLGVSSRGSDSAVIEATTIARNHAQVRGGGIYNAGTDLFMVNSTISDNQSVESGGGLYINSGRRAGQSNRILHSTIAYNQTSTMDTSGGIDLSGGELSLDHVIVSHNWGGGEFVDLGNYASSAIVDVNYGLIGVIAPGSSIAAKNLLLGIDPRLENLRPNGRFLQFPNATIGLLTHALIQDSPAIDAGDPNLSLGREGVPEFDQRGAPYSRIVAGIPTQTAAIVDLGAYEVQDRQSGTFSGNFDGDEYVSGSDFLIWQRNFGTAQGATQQSGDATGDGDVDENDLAVWLATYSNIGSTPPRRLNADPVDFAHSETTNLFAAAQHNTEVRSYRPALGTRFADEGNAADTFVFDGVAPLGRSTLAVPVSSRQLPSAERATFAADNREDAREFATLADLVFETL